MALEKKELLLQAAVACIAAAHKQYVELDAMREDAKAMILGDRHRFVGHDDNGVTDSVAAVDEIFDLAMELGVGSK